MSSKSAYANKQIIANQQKPGKAKIFGAGALAKFAKERGLEVSKNSK